MNRNTIIKRAVLFTSGVALGLNLFAGAAFAAPADHANVVHDNPSAAKFECPSNNDTDSLNQVSGHGANNDGGYQSTCNAEHEPGNGQDFGPGLHVGMPCAGCVGRADDKNPPGQYPDGSDHNSGYECDGRDRPAANQQGNGNHGIGDENPAHTGCASSTTPPSTCPDGTPVPASGTCGGGGNCPDGSQMPADGNCGGHGNNCPDGSQMPADGNCGSHGGSNGNTCPNGTPMPATGGCGSDNKGSSENRCPDGSQMAAGATTCATGATETVTPVVVTQPEIVGTDVLGLTVERPNPNPNPAPAAAPAAVEAITLVKPAPALAAAAPAGERVQVLGVTLQRSSPATLARTGVNTGQLLAVAGVLLALGLGLVRAGRRPTIATLD